MAWLILYLAQHASGLASAFIDYPTHSAALHNLVNIAQQIAC